MAGRTIALIGPPGSGKTVMIGETAVERPILFADVDRKVKATQRLSKYIHHPETNPNGDIFVWEVGEPLSEGKLSERVKALAQAKRAPKEPKGWSSFADFTDKLDSHPDALRAKTIVVDSTTQLQDHLKNHMAFINDKHKFNWDLWAAYSSIWADTTTILTDWCIAKGKDLIMTFHERVSEVPGENTRGVIVTTSTEGGKNRQYQGSMDIKICAAIQGAFGINFGTYFTEVYGLSVDTTDIDNPKWVCRVQPDGRRDLRTTFPVEKPDWEPDFRKIWGVYKPTLAEIAASQAAAKLKK